MSDPNLQELPTEPAEPAAESAAAPAAESAAAPAAESAAAPAVPAPSSTAAPSVPTGAVILTQEMFDRLWAAATKAAPQSEPIVAPKVRVTDETALHVGEWVRHNGRLAQIVQVIPTERDVNGQAWTQYLYRVAVAAEDRTLDAEDFGAL